MWNFKRNGTIFRKTGTKKRQVKKGRVILSPVAKAYMQARYNPWAEIRPMPCVPDVIGVPSEKRKLTIRGTFTGGSAPTGLAFIMFNPDLPLTNPLGTGDTTVTNAHWMAPVWLSNNNCNNLSLPNPAALSNASVAVLPTIAAPGYFDAGVTPSVVRAQEATVFRDCDWRCVGAGLRFKYVGPAELRAGTVVSVQPENNTQWQYGGVNDEVSLLQTFHMSKQEALTAGTHSMVWHPRKPTDLQYASVRANTLMPTPDTFVPNFAEGTGSLCFAIFGCPNGTNGGRFVFEIDAYYEFTGKAFPNKTQSHCDLIGMSMVQGLSSDEVDTRPGAIQHADQLRRIGGGTLPPSIIFYPPTENIKRGMGSFKSEAEAEAWNNIPGNNLI